MMAARVKNRTMNWYLRSIGRHDDDIGFGIMQRVSRVPRGEKKESMASEFSTTTEVAVSI
jgi:hypothetical protein